MSSDNIILNILYFIVKWIILLLPWQIWLLLFIILIIAVFIYVFFIKPIVIEKEN
jgi:hypothetical protein